MPHALLDQEIGRPEGFDDGIGGGDEEEIGEKEKGEPPLAGPDVEETAQGFSGSFLITLAGDGSSSRCGHPLITGNSRPGRKRMSTRNDRFVDST
jgi:hypothetical protein